MQNLGAGLYVMLFGMGIVFTALIAIMLAMMALERIFRVKEADGDSHQVAVTPQVEARQAEQPPAEGQPTGASLSSEVAAAIAVTIAHLRARGRSAVSGGLPISLGNQELDSWDWLWEEGMDDYGTTRGSDYATV